MDAMDGTELFLKIQTHLDMKIGEVWKGIDAKLGGLDGKLTNVGKDMQQCKDGCLSRIAALESRVAVREALNGKVEKDLAEKGIDWAKVRQTGVTALVVAGIIGTVGLIYRVIVAHPSILNGTGQ